MANHKNKTVAALLAFVGGSIGLHRFYLQGWQDKWGWLHAVSLPLSGVLLMLFPNAQPFFAFTPFILSVLTAFLVTLVIGVTPDDKWDARYNPASGRQSDSRWPIAVLLVLSLGIGATAVIFVIARAFDLLFTGGTYG